MGVIGPVGVCWGLHTKRTGNSGKMRSYDAMMKFQKMPLIVDEVRDFENYQLIWMYVTTHLFPNLLQGPGEQHQALLFLHGPAVTVGWDRLPGSALPPH